MTTIEKIRAEIEHMSCRQYEHKLMLDRQEVLETICKYAEQEPKQKTGRWMATEDYETLEINGYFCSVCDLPMETDEKTDYCPNCGARMVEPQEISDRNMKMWEAIFKAESEDKK